MTNEMKQYAVRKKIFCTGPTTVAKEGQKSMYRHDESNKPIKEGVISYVLESLFTLVSTREKTYSFSSQQRTPFSSLSAGTVA
jgi:hypothetical protein